MTSRKVAADEGLRLQLGAPDDYLLFKVFGEETGGRFEQYWKHLPPGAVGATPHVHVDTDQYFAVLKGRLTLGTSRGDVELGPGDVYVVERGTPHMQRNDGSEPAEVLIAFAPARGHDRYFAQCQELTGLPEKEQVRRLDEIRRRFASYSCDLQGTPTDGLPALPVTPLDASRG